LKADRRPREALRVHASSVDELDALVDRILTADSLETALG
jgi:hypothetical protein